MAEIQQKEEGGRKKGKQKKINVHVDFTPMVDMNMLLITFFMLCTSMSKPQTMEISMPRKDVLDNEEQVVKESAAITVLLGKDRSVFYYFGKIEEAHYENPGEILVETSFSPEGLRAMLLGRNQAIMRQIRELKIRKENLEITQQEYSDQAADIRKEDKESPVVMIKATDFATYENLIDVLDEVLICNIGRYAIVDITDGDLRLLEEFTKDGYAAELETVVIEVEQK